MRVIRQKIEVFQGELKSLKHHQDDVREVRTGFDCGIALKDFEDYEEGDILESFELEQVAVV